MSFRNSQGIMKLLEEEELIGFHATQWFTQNKEIVKLFGTEKMKRFFKAQ